MYDSHSVANLFFDTGDQYIGVITNLYCGLSAHWNVNSFL